MVVVFITFAIALLLSYQPAHSQPDVPWWNNTWHYRISLTVNTTGYTRTDWPVEYRINFTQILQQLNVSGTFDENSTILFETNSSGWIIDSNFPSQFDPADDFNASFNAVGDLVFLLNGTNPQNTLRYFTLYFDIKEKQSHNRQNYDTGMNATWDGEEIEVNTTRLVVNIDTVRGEHTSGIYDIFDIPGNAYVFEVVCGDNDRTREWTEFGNESDRFGFDLASNATITDGPVRITVKQEGDEIYWNESGNKTGQLYLDKRYYFYKSTAWLKVSQNVTNKDTNPVNRTANGSALALDAYEAFNLGSGYRTDKNTTDPGSWVLAQESGGRPWAAYLNLNESYANFYANTSATSTGPVGIWMDEIEIQPNESLYHETIIVTNVSGASTGILDMNDFQKRIMNPVNVTLGSAERWIVDIRPLTDHLYYNLNESSIIMGNITSDSWNLTNNVNATLDNGTTNPSDDMTIILYDDGSHGDTLSADSVWSSYYNLTNNSVLGEWNFTIRVYDPSGYFLNESNGSFTVTDELFANITFENQNGLGERIVNATLNITNYRQDTEYPSCNVTCEADGVPVEENNITDNGDGTYLVQFSAPLNRGTYYLVCNATRDNNFGTDTAPYYVEAANTTISITPTPENYTAYNVTWFDNETFYLEVFINNTGFSSMYTANFSLVLPSEIVSNQTLPHESLGTIPPEANATLGFNITVLNATAPQTLFVNLTVNWTNFDNSTGFNYTVFNITVESNPILDVIEESLTAIEGPGNQSTVNFTVLSYGNDELLNVTYHITGLDPNITVTFVPGNITSLSAGSSQVVQANVNISPDQNPGIYQGILNVTTNNTNHENITFEVIVTGTNLTITNEPSGFTAGQVTYYQSQSFDLKVNVTNTGNITSFFTNITLSLPGNFTTPQDYYYCGNLTAGSSCSYNFTITIVNNTAPGNYTINSTAHWTDIGIAARTNESRTNVTVTSNVILLVPENQFTDTMEHNTTTFLGNITLNSTGNSKIINVSYTITGMAGFTFNFTPDFPFNMSPGDVIIVSANLTASAGHDPGVYNGSINVTTGNNGYHIINLSITVPENGSWVMIPEYCERFQNEDTGIVCNVSVNNTGNMLLNFNITPLYENYTYITDTNFSVAKQDYHIFAVYFDITGQGEPKQWQYSNYSINATYNYSVPGERFLFVALNPQIEANIIIVLSPNITQQISNVDIDVTVTSLSGNPIRCDDEGPPPVNCTIMAYVYRPDGNVSNHTLQYNGGQVSGTSYWTTAYPDYLGDVWGNTILRGNYTVSIFIQDNSSVNTTKNETLRIYADLAVTSTTGKPVYKTGDSVTLRYHVMDMNNENLSNVNATVTITDPAGYVLVNNTYTTNQNGTPASSPYPDLFTIKSDYPEGRYAITTHSLFYDNIVPWNVTDTTTNYFDVYDSIGMDAEIVTRDVWFPNSTMTFDLLVKDAAGLPIDPDTMNMTVYYGNPILGNVLFETNLTNGNPAMNKNSTGRYLVSYVMGTTIQSGDYWAVLKATKGGLHTVASRAFSIAAWGPYDLRIELITAEVQQGQWFNFNLIIDNKGEYGRDVDLRYWVEGAGQTWYSLPDAQPTYTPAGQNITVPGTRVFIFSDQPPGIYTLHATINDTLTDAGSETSVTFKVLPGGAPPGPPGPGPTGPAAPAGGGGAPPTPKIEISKYPTEVAVMVGLARFPNIHVRNPGGTNLTNVTLEVSGIPPEWYDISPKSVALLNPNETTVFTFRILVPGGTKAGKRKVIIAAVSGDSRDEKTFDLLIFTSMKELVHYELERLKDALDEFMIKVDNARNIKDLTDVLLLVDEIEKQISKAERYLSDERYEDALDAIYAGWNLLDKAEYLLSTAPNLFVFPWWLALIIAFGIVVAMLVIYIRRISTSLKTLIRGRTTEIGKLTSSVKREDDSEKLKVEKNRLERMLNLLEQQRKQGIISQEAYNSLKKRTETRLAEINRKLS